MTISSIDDLAVGDIVISHVGAAGHTTVITKKTLPGTLLSDYEVAHCPGPRQSTELAGLDTAHGSAAPDELFAYRWLQKDRRELAATLAEFWSTANTTIYGSVPARETATNASRARGVALQWDHGRGPLPAFEYDALYRVFKWAERHGNKLAFSANRGTTCCSFVMACFQTAAMLNALRTVSSRAPKTMFKLLSGGRKQKGEGDGTHSHPVDDMARRENANRGSKERKSRRMIRSSLTVEGTHAGTYSGVEGLWRYLQAVTGFNTWLTLADIFSAPLLYDAKFTYTLAFKGRLDARPVGWTTV